LTGKLTQGVRFEWKESGQPALGFIAEDVEKVLPEVVARDAASGEVRAVNYSAIVPVLVEAIKQQQKDIEAYKIVAQATQAELVSLRTKVTEIESIKAQLAELRQLATVGQASTILVKN